MEGWVEAERVCERERNDTVVALCRWSSTFGGCTMSMSLYTMCDRMGLAGRGRAVTMCSGGDHSLSAD